MRAKRNLRLASVWGDGRAHVSDNAFPCESGIPFGVSSLASQRLPHPSQSALAGQRIHLRPNGMAVRFSITRSLASLGFRLACPPSRATACFDRLCPHLRVNACSFRPNGMAVRGSLVLGLTIMRSFVRGGVVECAVAVTHRQPATANATGHRTSIPFGQHAIPKTLALADDIALSD